MACHSFDIVSLQIGLQFQYILPVNESHRTIEFLYFVHENVIDIQRVILTVMPNVQYTTFLMDSIDTLERFRLRTSSAPDLIRAWEILRMVSGGEPAKTPDKASENLWLHDYYNGRQFGRFHVVRTHAATEQIVGLTYSSWFDSGLRLDTISLDPTYRGIGLGARMITTLANVALKRDVEQIWLYATPKPQVLQFYKELGFSALPPTDYRVDSETESRCVPMVADTTLIIEKPIKPLSLSGVIL